MLMSGSQFHKNVSIIEFHFDKKNNQASEIKWKLFIPWRVFVCFFLKEIFSLETDLLYLLIILKARYRQKLNDIFRWLQKIFPHPPK